MDTTVAVAVAVVHIVALYIALDGEQKQCLDRGRLNWKHHSQLLLNEGQFRQYYRMSFRAFENLVALLAPRLRVNEAESRRRPGIDPISPVNKVQMCISWFAGYSFHPVRALAGSSKTAFYNSIHEVMEAIQAEDELQLRFPISRDDQRASARSFAALSLGRALTGCVGAIDGWLCEIQVPRRTEVKKVTSFFSGHYQCYGINVQACVDHHSRFIAVSSKCPGGMGGALAYQKWSLSEIAEVLPVGMYLIGDNAYSNSNKLLTPFTKPKTKTPVHDSFNFHLSQLRIRVEMAFGLLVNKWRIFKQPLKVRMKNVKKVIHVACILHNWCINQRLEKQCSAAVVMDEDLVQAVSELNDSANRERAVQQCDLSMYRRLYRSTQQDSDPTVDTELVRNAIMYKLRSSNQLRPHNNIRRAAEEIAQP